MSLQEVMSMDLDKRDRKLPTKFLVLVLVLSLSAVALLLPAYFQRDRASALNSAQGEERMQFRSFGKVRAPELSGGNGWLNTDHPIKLADLRGKVVLLDFWTYCCINCMHIIPDLKKLETKYSKELVVIGVHSAKFENERESQNIRQAILRYEIQHPVVNDSAFNIWQSYGVHAWPTLVLIDTEGYVADAISGEGIYNTLDSDIGQLVAESRANGKLNEQPLKLILEKQKVADGVLSFPGKVLADQANNRLFIADSNHNRIVITNLSGETIDVIGSGQIGRADGDYTTANFNHPQGLALSADGALLYVADTENHLLRRVDLKKKLVLTIAGTGRQAHRLDEIGLGPNTSLNSPWDLKLIGDKLFIAMAGPHQIWMMELKTSRIGPFAGSGREGREDGPRMRAALAQPSGLAFDGKLLYVADSEISSIRAIDVGETGDVTTVAGSGELFGFGDKDGRGESARLQHPLGVEFTGGLLYVADTYNHKIKVIDPKDMTCKTLFGSGKPGHEDGTAARFYEPGGLSAVGDKLYIADTDNHAIRIADLKTKEVKTLKISGLSAPTEKAVAGVLPNREDIALPVQKLSPGKAAELIIDLKLPKGYHLNPDSPQRYNIKTADAGIKIDESAKAAALKNPELPLKIAFNSDSDAQKAKLQVEFTFYYCPVSNEGACLIKSLVWDVPIEFDKNYKADAIKLHYEVK